MTLTEESVLFQNAVTRFQQRRFSDAEKIAQHILKENPNHADAHHLLGLIAIEHGQYADADHLITCAIAKNPNQYLYHFNHGLALQSSGRLDEAIEAYEQSIQLNPACAEAHSNRGNVLKILGRPNDALAAYDYALNLSPERALFHCNRGTVLVILGRIEEALTAYEKAVQIAPEFSEAHCARGTCLRVLGHLPEAAAAFRLAIAHNPAYTDAKYYLAAIGEEEAPSQSPREYVVKEFDGLADHFDDKLVNDLGYRVPQLLLDAINRHREHTKKLDILDLGCGTGLSGLALSSIADQLVGVDLAPRMLVKAEERGIYTELIEADICQAMKQIENKFDLVISTDVFVYIGALDEVFESVSQHLNPGGLFAFSIEFIENSMDYQLRETGRYAQSHRYIEKLSTDCKFKELNRTPVTVRYDGGKPIAGSVFVLQLDGPDMDGKTPCLPR